MVESLVEVRNLELSYGKQKIVDKVSFQLYPGRIMALIGPNGAGKSSIMRIMAGLVKPEKGEMLFKGKKLFGLSDIHSDAGFFIEGPDFYKNLTASQNLTLLKKIKNDEKTVKDLLKVVGIEYAANKKVRKFSRGMKQRLGIAQALIGDPSVLVLDEPFNGLDPEVKKFLMDMIRELAMEKKKAILVSSHLLSDLETLADDFLLLSEGKVHVAGRMSDFKNEKQTVVFWFIQQPPQALLEEFSDGKLEGNGPWRWETSLNINETSACVQKLSAAGFAPYEIDRADLLQTKYMEIIK